MPSVATAGSHPTLVTIASLGCNSRREEYSMIHTPIGDKYCLEISLPDNYSPPRGRHTRCLNNTLTTTKKDRATFRSGVWKLISDKKTIILGILITTHHPQTRAATQTPYNIPNLPPPPKPHRQSHPLSIGHDGQMIIKNQAPHKTLGGDYLACLRRSSNKYWGTYPSNNA